MKALKAHRFIGRQADRIGAGGQAQLSLMRRRVRKNAARRSLMNLAPYDLLDLRPRRTGGDDYAIWPARQKP